MFTLNSHDYGWDGRSKRRGVRGLLLLLTGTYRQYCLQMLIWFSVKCKTKRGWCRGISRGTGALRLVELNEPQFHKAHICDDLVTAELHSINQVTYWPEKDNAHVGRIVSRELAGHAVPHSLTNCHESRQPPLCARSPSHVSCGRSSPSLI